MRLRFSLRTFLLVLILMSLVASNVFTSWQLYQLREENGEMRKALGRLVVKDREKVNIVAVPTYEDPLWRWRIYVPAGNSLYLLSSTQDIPEHGFSANPGQSGPLPEGEYVLTAAIRPDRNGNWQVTIAGPHSSFSFGIAPDPLPNV